ncbi:hypothetical protein [Nocardioides sp. KR10-350]|uniref:hypothetical protein n=1 Tax=Nocardioides cheoyonin TaxID=3156615 RepID=UPI0032B33DBE
MVVTVPGTPGGTDTDPGPGGGSGSTVPATCDDIYTGEEVPCTDPNAGAWFPNAMNGAGCNAYMLQPQPKPGSPLWEGHDPSEGSVWGCDTDFANNGNTFFVPNGQGPTVVDPAVLAQRALGRMKLVTADAKIAPGPNFHTYINIDNWLWIPPEQWHTLNLSVSAGPTTVTVTAAPVRVDWNMGNGETKQCADAGRPSTPGMGESAKTTCSYAYTSLTNPDGDTHTVSAQLVYAVTWACTGTCLTPSGDLGEITAPAGQTTSIEVRQRQTVVTH